MCVAQCAREKKCTCEEWPFSMSIIIKVAVWHSLRTVKKNVQVATVVHFSFYSKKGVFMSLLKSMDARTK